MRALKDDITRWARRTIEDQRTAVGSGQAIWRSYDISAACMMS